MNIFELFNFSVSNVKDLLGEYKCFKAASANKIKPDTTPQIYGKKLTELSDVYVY